MPAGTRSSVGSSAIRLAEGTMVCPRFSKKRRKRRAISADSMSAAILYVVVIGVLNSVEPEPGSQLGFPLGRAVQGVAGEFPHLVQGSGGVVHGAPGQVVRMQCLQLTHDPHR